MTEPTYPALLAGLDFGLSATSSGFAITIGGYNDKQREFLSFVLDRVLTAPLSQARFNTMKQSLVRDLQNTTKDKPYNQALTALNNALLASSWPAEQQAALLSTTSLTQLENWRREQFTTLAVIGGLHGNVDEQDAENLADLLTTLLPLNRVSRTRPSVQQIKESASIDLAVDHNDAALLIYVQDPNDSFASRAQSALAGQLLRSPFFSSLRTDQQLGYVVSAGIRRMDTQSGNLFLVQSPSAGVAHIENAVMVFLEQYIAQWDALPKEAFEQQKAGLITRLMEKDKNLAQRSQRYWRSLSEENFAFDSNRQIADQVSGLNKQDMKAFLEDLYQRVQKQRLLIFSVGAIPEATSGDSA
jgi:secreted Zn-dependent insulinase-like peptidase